MQPTPHFPRIKIVPITQCIAHEGVVARWVDNIASNLLDEGVMKNPIITSTADRTGRRIVIDGMHRFAALAQLEIPDVAVYEIDYHASDVTLGGWDALTFRPFHAKAFVHDLFGTSPFTFSTTRQAAAAQQAVDARIAVLAACDRRGTYYLVQPRRRATVQQCVTASQRLDEALDARGYRPLYVADTLSLADFARTKASGVIIRPHYTKAEIMDRTVGGKLFPRKSTRHMIPGRPLRVDIGLALLRANISLRAKNQLLEEQLKWCYESDRIRYYSEPIFIYAD